MLWATIVSVPTCDGPSQLFLDPSDKNCENMACNGDIGCSPLHSVLIYCLLTEDCLQDNVAHKHLLVSLSHTTSLLIPFFGPYPLFIFYLTGCNMNIRSREVQIGIEISETPLTSKQLYNSDARRARVKGGGASPRVRSPEQRIVPARYSSPASRCD